MGDGNFGHLAFPDRMMRAQKTASLSSPEVMVPSFPTIQSFYRGELPDTSDSPQNRQYTSGDGFTGQEVSSTLRPLSQPWNPDRVYRKQSISRLHTGSGHYEVTGRIVNFTQPGTWNNPQSSTEEQYLILLSDDTGVIAVSVTSGPHRSYVLTDTQVRMLYPKPCNLNLIFGNRVTIYTAYITDFTGSEPGYLSHVDYCTTICPARSNATHIDFHQDTPSSEQESTFRIPPSLHLQSANGHPGLMSLESFLSSGFDVGEGEILVCVRSVRPQTTFQRRRRETTIELAEIDIFDDSTTSILKLWGDHAASAKSFVPNQTLLLISQPTCHAGATRGAQEQHASELSVGYHSMIFVDPDTPQSRWMRSKITELSRKHSIVTMVPEDAWDLEEVDSKPVSMEIYTIAEADERVRKNFEQEFAGKMCVMILEVNIITLWRKGRFCCAEW